MAGKAAGLNEIQAALPGDAALVAWVDVPPHGPKAADPDGEHWGVVVRSRGVPAWVALTGTGPDGLWTKDDIELADKLRAALRRKPGAGTVDLRPQLERLRAQRLNPVATALGATADGLSAARQLIVLPSRAMAGIPIEVLLTQDDTRAVSYAPSGTVYKYLREQPRPDRHAGLLALGGPVFEHRDKLSDFKPVPDHGLMLSVVVHGSEPQANLTESRRCLARLQRPIAPQRGRTSRLSQRARNADCRRGVETGQLVAPRAPFRQARRGVRPSAGS